TTYVYNGDGERFKKVVSGVTTRYVYDGANLLDDGTQKYVYGIGLAYEADHSTGALKGVEHTDGLGSVRAITDSSSSVIQTYGTDEFGIVNATQTTGTVTQPMQYTGSPRDSESSFEYLQARYYDPNVGRFLSQDPLQKSTSGIGGWNRYAYVGDNPVTASDPSGL